MVDQSGNDFLCSEEVAAYQRDGYLLRPNYVSVSVISELMDEASRIQSTSGPQRIFERDGRTVRSVYGPHLLDEVVSRFCRLPRMLDAVTKLLGCDEIYVHQSKINIKAPFVGDSWDWHQDYIYWLQEDGIKKPALINVAVFLDEVTEFNGPLTLIPGSHNRGVLAATEIKGMPAGYEDAPEWVATLTADEKYSVRRHVIEALVKESGLTSPKGPAGSVLFFHPNILHASGPNISPFGRTTLILVYNAVANPPTNMTSPRPAFLSASVIAPLEPLS